MAISISSFLVPKNGGTFFLIEDKYIRGGLRVVANAEERNSIDVLSRKVGMIVITADDGLVWSLNADLSTWTEKLLQGEPGPQGPQGPQGTSLQINAVGLFADRAVHDNEPEKFIFLASDTNQLFVKLSADPGDWSQGISFGVGPQGPKGDPGLVNRGPYDSQIAYNVGDVVTENGSAYSSKTNANLGNLVNDGINWELLVSTGPQGPQGDHGPQGPQGEPGLSHVGEYSELIPYNTGNIVTVNGSAYVSLVDNNLGNPVTDNTKWNLFVAKGDQGIQGPQGLQGPQGEPGIIGPHAASHATGGGDEITPADIGALPNTGGLLTGNLFIEGTALYSNSFATILDLPDPSIFDGAFVKVVENGTAYFSHAGTWLPLAIAHTLVIPYDLAFFIPEVTEDANAVVGSFLAPRVISLPQDLPGSLAKAKIAPSTNTNFSLKVGNTEIGTISFSSGSTNGVFTFSNNVNLQVGDVLDVVTSNTPDTTVKNIAITIIGRAQAPETVML